MNGAIRWGTGAHRSGCDHLWSEWMDAKETPLAYLRPITPVYVRWCLFCVTTEYR